MSFIWRLVRGLFGKPRGRHAVGVGPPPPPVVPPPDAAEEPRPLAPPVPVDLGTVRLIFGDGSALPLVPGSPEDRRARYLAESVLEATHRR